MNEVEIIGQAKTEKQNIDYTYVPVPVAERIPDLPKLYYDKLVLLDQFYDIIKVVNVGFATDWEMIKAGAVYWLERRAI